jgi:hypothetical protein
MRSPRGYEVRAAKMKRHMGGASVYTVVMHEGVRCEGHQDDASLRMV